MTITSIRVNLPNGWVSKTETTVRSQMRAVEKKCQIHALNHTHPYYDDEDHLTSFVVLTPCTGDKWEMDVGDVINAFGANGFTVTITTESAPEKID
jgi:hypothetical protein